MRISLKLKRFLEADPIFTIDQLGADEPVLILSGGPGDDCLQGTPNR